MHCGREMSRALFIFAREPEPGRIKTRLGDCLEEEEISRIYIAMVKDAVETSKKVRCDNLVLAFAAEKTPRVLMKIAPDLQFYKQEGAGLGERMHNAFVFSKKQGYTGTVIIGSDAPTLPAELIEKAFRELEENDLVLGPAKDGGYYLAGLNNPCRELFSGIEWSCPGVLDETLKKSQGLGMKTAVLEEWFDVDDREGLTRLAEHFRSGGAGPGRHTKAALKLVKGLCDEL